MDEFGSIGFYYGIDKWSKQFEGIFRYRPVIIEDSPQRMDMFYPMVVLTSPEGIRDLLKFDPTPKSINITNSTKYHNLIKVFTTKCWKSGLGRVLEPGIFQPTRK